MALINYPPQTSNIWPTPKRDFSSEIMMQAMFRHTEMKMRLHGTLQKAFAEIDPVEFISDKNLEQQAKEIKKLEDYITEIYARGKWDITQKDVMNVQFQIKKFEDWQAKAQKGLTEFAAAKDVYNKTPAGYYDPGQILSGFYYLKDHGESPPGGYLRILPKSQSETAAKLAPFGKDGVTTTLVKTIDGVDHKYTAMRYGILTDDRESIDEEASRSARTKAWASVLARDKQVMVDALREYEALTPQEKETWKQRAKMLNDNNLVKGADAQGRQPEKVHPAYLYSLQTYGTEDYIQPRSFVQGADFTPASRLTEEKPPAPEPTRYTTRGENMNVITTTEATPLVATVAVRKGEKRPLSKGKFNHFEAHNFKGYGKIYTPQEPPKDAKYRLNPSAVITKMPDNDRWDIEMIGNSASEIRDKSESVMNYVGEEFNVSNYNIRERFPVYVGEETLFVEPIDKRGNKERYVICPQEPLSQEKYKALQNHNAELAVENVDLLDVAVISAKGGMADQTHETFEFIDVLTNELKALLGIDFSEPAEGETLEAEEEVPEVKKTEPVVREKKQSGWGTNVVDRIMSGITRKKAEKKKEEDPLKLFE